MPLSRDHAVPAPMAVDGGRGLSKLTSPYTLPMGHSQCPVHPAGSTRPGPSGWHVPTQVSRERGSASSPGQAPELGPSSRCLPGGSGCPCLGAGGVSLAGGGDEEGRERLQTEQCGGLPVTLRCPGHPSREAPAVIWGLWSGRDLC